MNPQQILTAIAGLKILHHYDIEIDNPTEEETAYFFAECEKRGFIPKWLNANTIRVTNCAGTTKIQKTIARLSNDEMAHIHGLLVAAGISVMMKNRYKAFCDLFERERKKAKKARNEKWEKIYRALAKAEPIQVELTIRAIEM
jgi:hypothetical protein